LFVICIAAGLLISCAKSSSPPNAALAAIQGESFMKHLRTLASDEFEGRGPGSNGEEKTVKYLEEQFRAAGLDPGNPDGTFIQKVPLVGITADPRMRLAISGKGRAELKYRDDFMAWTKRVVDRVALDAEMVFVGYGVQAPEFHWDDFRSADVKGKVIVVLVNDPPLDDPKMFGGKAMTYYGRWSYKYEKAAELGAAGCFIIHETGPAGYPWEVIKNGRFGEQFDLNPADRNMGRAAVEGWTTWDAAVKLFKLAGQNLEALKKTAASPDFKPVPLGLRAKLEIKNTLRTFDSRNVVAKLTGSDDQLRNEYVIYTAHWDHFGNGPEVNGDKIYNGALDNASGTSALLEIARAYRALEVPPRRSILFLAVTAEEQGLLGSEYYAANPLYPLAATAAVVNMDGINMHGRTRDIVFIGKGTSSLDEIAETSAKIQNRTVDPDPEPEKGFFYRSDHFPFAKQGVPAFNPNRGIQYLGKPEGWGLEVRRKYTAEDYHKPSDQVKPDWVTDGAVEDMQLFFRIGYSVANEPVRPEWKPGTEFKAKREESLRKAGKM
jgi:Zn-dependent M28 family amino/carboxypeptidase